MFHHLQRFERRLPHFQASILTAEILNRFTQSASLQRRCRAQTTDDHVGNWVLVIVLPLIRAPASGSVSPFESVATASGGSGGSSRLIARARYWRTRGSSPLDSLNALTRAGARARSARTFGSAIICHSSIAASHRPPRL